MATAERTETLAINEQTVTLSWDDETDTENSVGWIAEDEHGNREAVGPNVYAEYRHLIESVSDFERWAMLAHLQQETLVRAIAEARVLFA